MSTGDPTAPGPVPPPPPPPADEPRPVEPFVPPTVPQAPVGTLPGSHGGAAPLYGTSVAATDTAGQGFADPFAVRGADDGMDDAARHHDADAPGGSQPPPGPSPYGTPPPYGTSSPYATPSPHGAPSPYGAPTAGPSPMPGGPGAWPVTHRGTAALVLGLVALVLAWVPFVGVIALPLGIAAIVSGARAGSRGRRSPVPSSSGRATGGIALGVVAVLVAVVAQASYAVVGTTTSEGRGSEVVVDGPFGGAAEDGAADGGTVDGGAVDGDAVVPPWEPLTVGEVAFGAEPDEPGTWWYVAVIDNPNPEHRFDSAQLSVEALGADGTLIAADWQYVTAVPGEVAVTGRFRDLGDMAPDRVDVRLPLVQRVAHSPGAGVLTVGELTSRVESWGGVTVEGTVSSTLEEDVDAVRVVVVATADDGRIVAAARGYAEQLRAGGEAAFDATFFQELPPGTTFTSYASP
ncbi:hypothetical protein [Cellulomonas xiejunii]|uniref:hypothetical protein n=1 Tax=Cellulomonas xiejunii TaxID=2968083 RepID=UPI001D0F49A1|nr:hypothetical protein [Cellulomonas xiejunii]MCC2314112.1 hypothetical protein [Cellulomonas xiejunii]